MPNNINDTINIDVNTNIQGKYPTLTIFGCFIALPNAHLTASGVNPQKIESNNSIRIWWQLVSFCPHKIQKFANTISGDGRNCDQ